MECGIDGWATGINVELPFYGSDYKPIYIRHVKTLRAFGVGTSKYDLLGLLQRSLFNFGRCVPLFLFHLCLLNDVFKGSMQEFRRLYRKMALCYLTMHSWLHWKNMKMMIILRRMVKIWIRAGIVLCTSWIPGAVRKFLFFVLYYLGHLWITIYYYI